MTCEDALVLLSGHLDGENSEEEEAQLSAHLRQCPACRELLAAFQAADQGILSPGGGAAPDTAARDSRCRLQGAAAKAPRPRHPLGAARRSRGGAGHILWHEVLAHAGVQSTDTAAVSYDAATPRAVAEDSVDAAARRQRSQRLPRRSLILPRIWPMRPCPTPSSPRRRRKRRSLRWKPPGAGGGTRAAVLVLETMDAALEALPAEEVGGMTVITLPDAQALSALQESHPEATLVEPTSGTATAYLALIEAP